MAHDPNRLEVWYHSNAGVYFLVFHGKRVRIVSESGASATNQVLALVAYGAANMTGEPAPGNIFFLEALPEESYTGGGATLRLSASDTAEPEPALPPWELTFVDSPEELAALFES